MIVSSTICSARATESGFTLFEVVITIVVMSIIALIAAMIIASGMSGYSGEVDRADVHYQARLAMERIAREARLIRSCADITAPANPSSNLAFTDINGSAVTFSVSGGTMLRGADLLAHGITSAQPFRFLDDAGNPVTACPGIWFVEVAVTATQGSESVRMRTRVHPRNF
jgi:prepilin-type N-terminal cleavage/methylation domain-containing protein